MTYDELKKLAVPDTTNVPEKLMLVVTEVAEAMEDLRDGKPSVVSVLNEAGKPSGFPSELADAIIRLLDLARSLGIDISQEVALKMAYNETRPHKHGRQC
jgi:NTP pyrophosphatase (non-canonical NTP hydrolase)